LIIPPIACTSYLESHWNLTGISLNNGFCDLPQDFYFAPNGVTVLCPGAAVGDTGFLDGVLYTKRDRAALDALVAANPTDEAALARSCTSGVTDMSELFGDPDNFDSKVSDPTTFNPDLSSWDTSSVTNMEYMFTVRVPPARVLLLLLRRFIVFVDHPLAPRSPLTPHGRPSLAAL
jgi:hypothetical protein